MRRGSRMGLNLRKSLRGAPVCKSLLGASAELVSSANPPARLAAAKRIQRERKRGFRRMAGTLR